MIIRAGRQRKIASSPSSCEEEEEEEKGRMPDGSCVQLQVGGLNLPRR